MFDALKEKISGGEKIAIIVLVVILVGAALWRGAGHRSTVPELVRSGFEEPLDAVFEPAQITVHLVGAVNKPGVYHLPEGARVYELLELAGGFSPEAAQESVNQARPLFDGEQVYIAGYDSQTASSENRSPEGSTAGIININTAQVAELKTLPGIGEVKAGQIVAHREKYGFFKDPRELMEVSGIGEKTYENIADLITVY